MSDARRAQAVAALSALDRRSFLRLAGLAAASGLLPTGCGAAPAPLLPPPGLELRFLTPRTFAVFTAAAARLVGPAGAERIAAGRMQPGVRAEAFLASAPSLAGTLRQALLALEFGIPPLLAKLRPFTALAAPDQEAILHELMDSRFEIKRLLFGGVRSLALLACYGDPVSREWFDYPPERPRAGADIQAAHDYPSDS
ncbi:MAG TPA: hypothetical protein VII72_05050 [Myxococcota bacterium]|jgi:hypothetical protein